MDERVTVATKASTEIESYLNNLSNTIWVVNVEKDPHYQKDDIDLLFKRTIKRGTFETTIEIKADTQGHRTGNYFFETKSNKEKNTPGCFMYSKAELLFYYFTETKELHIFSLPDVRKWFIKNINSFKERETKTKVNGSSYTTVGKLVPIEKVIKQVKHTIINL